MKSLGLFETKTRLSEVCEEVAATGEAVVVTRRGKPWVRIVPLEPEYEQGESAVWEAREAHDRYNGPLEQELPDLKRQSEPFYNPLEDA